MIHTISRDGKTITLTKEEVRDVIEAYAYITRPDSALYSVMTLIEKIFGPLGSYVRCADRHMSMLPLHDELLSKGEAYACDALLYECVLAEWTATNLFKHLRTDLDKRNSILACIDMTIRDRIAQIESALTCEEDIYTQLLRDCVLEAVNSKNDKPSRKRSFDD